MKYTERNKNLLKKIKNPTHRIYSNTHTASEVTFIGSYQQPDFCKMTIDIVYGEYMIELKSLKEYFFQWRDIHVSYERFLDSVYSDLWDIYHPKSMVVSMITNIRGGISSELTMASGHKSI